MPIACLVEVERHPSADEGDQQGQERVTDLPEAVRVGGCDTERPARGHVPDPEAREPAPLRDQAIPVG